MKHITSLWDNVRQRVHMTPKYRGSKGKQYLVGQTSRPRVPTYLYLNHSKMIQIMPCSLGIPSTPYVTYQRAMIVKKELLSAKFGTTECAGNDGYLHRERQCIFLPDPEQSLNAQTRFVSDDHVWGSLLQKAILTCLDDARRQLSHRYIQLRQLPQTLFFLP